MNNLFYKDNIKMSPSKNYYIKKVSLKKYIIFYK
jgi:hypothetical protein